MKNKKEELSNKQFNKKRKSHQPNSYTSTSKNQKEINETQTKAY
jgi:hypothetical protein